MFMDLDMKLYYENVIDTLQGKTEPLCDGREGLKALNELIGAYRSGYKNLAQSISL